MPGASGAEAEPGSRAHAAAVGGDAGLLPPEPGDVPGAGRAAGVSPYIARKAWREGGREYPALDGFLAEEAEEAERGPPRRAGADARAAQEAAGLAEARRALEAREAAVRAGRRREGHRVRPGGRAPDVQRPRARAPGAQVEVPRIEGAIKTMTPVEILRALRLMQGIVARGVEAGRLLMDMDKLHAGNAAPLAEVRWGGTDGGRARGLRGLLGDHAGAARGSWKRPRCRPTRRRRCETSSKPGGAVRGRGSRGPRGGRDGGPGGPSGRSRSFEAGAADRGSVSEGREGTEHGEKKREGEVFFLATLRGLWYSYECPEGTGHERTTAAMPRSLRSALDALTTDAARTYERAFTAEEAGASTSARTSSAPRTASWTAPRRWRPRPGSPSERFGANVRRERIPRCP